MLPLENTAEAQRCWVGSTLALYISRLKRSNRVRQDKGIVFSNQRRHSGRESGWENAQEGLAKGVISGSLRTGDHPGLGSPYSEPRWFLSVSSVHRGCAPMLARAAQAMWPLSSSCGSTGAAREENLNPGRWGFGGS